ncbi:DUF1850 domain-containing protein [Roseinatronobacter alkalisoli]|uniref:DUF1850 domain-containing protein n=1 Tax=Roseinatronobacter alkalisoli TaxID=3028235 RepID=A0ABT5T891_9RHOB|nr:DUF1850 domain-containing protein [Roseinatronobacter sp. HJB301]MDD7971196.1 DUF1850 domain-containing protein [Roseinatronobacter sp. HJB301]
MADGISGRLVLAALFLPTIATADPALQARLPTGDLLGQLPMPEGAEICLRWAHSVTGGAVADCFENRAGQLTLTRSYLHDFAAGLGEVTGRGSLIPAQGGGYWIVGMDEVIPANSLSLRIGSVQTGHRLTDATQELALSAEAAQGARVWLHLNTHP